MLTNEQLRTDTNIVLLLIGQRSLIELVVNKLDRKQLLRNYQ